MHKFSVIIPTLQKNLKILNMLLKELIEDNTVGEIILIDNSLQGFENKSEKLRVIIPKKNLYVNPSWNLGVKLAKYDYIAILNDDIVISKNLCEQVMKELVENSINGIIGMSSESTFSATEDEFDSYPEDSKLDLEVQGDNLYTIYWGAALFGKKDSFYEIPKNLKIYCGDNYLLHQNTQNNNTCYQIKNCVIKHLCSLSSNAGKLNKIKTKDVYNYAKIDKRFKNHSWYKKKLSFLESIFSVKNEDVHKVVTIFNLKLKFKSKKLARIKNLIQKEKDLQLRDARYKEEINRLSIRLDNYNLKYKKDIYKQKSILYIDYEIFQPDTNAGDRASFSYLKALCKKNYNVYFLPYNVNVTDKDKYIEAIKNVGAEIILTSDSCNNHYFVDNWLKENGKFFDFVFVNRPNIYEEYRDILNKYATNAKFIYQGHDIHFLRKSRMLEIDPENVNANDIENMKKLELSIWEKMDMVLYFSDKEVEIVKSYSPNVNTGSVPLFLYSDIEKAEYEPQARKDLLFVGGFKHTPNIDAVKWFLNDIFPIIFQNNPKIRFHVVGSNCPNDIKSLANDNIIIHGYLSDNNLQKLYNKTKIVIAPLRYGAGVKGKIIEAMKNQIPVVTTSIGAEGINSEFLTIADKEEDFASAILDLYNDNQKLAYIANNSYYYIKENFSEKFIDKLIKYVDDNCNNQELINLE